MKNKITHFLLLLVSLLLLVAYAFAIPSPALLDEAKDSYMNESNSEDDEYAFLFD